MIKVPTVFRLDKENCVQISETLNNHLCVGSYGICVIVKRNHTSNLFTLKLNYKYVLRTEYLGNEK